MRQHHCAKRNHHVAGWLYAIAAVLLAWGRTPLARGADPMPAETASTAPMATLGAHHFVHNDRLENLAFSADGRAILGSTHEDTCLWEVASGRRLQAWPGAWMCGTLSADGQTVALAANGPYIDIFDAKTAKQTIRLPLTERGSRAVALTPDGRRAAGAQGATVIVWDLPSGKEVHRWPQDGGSISALRFLPGGRLAIAEDQGIMCIRNLEGDQAPVQLEGGAGFRGWLASTPDGKTLAGSCDVSEGGVTHSSLRLWDAATGRATHVVPGSFEAGAFSPDGSRLAASDLDKLRIFDVASGKELRQWSNGNEHVFAVAYSPDGKTLAIGQGKRIRFWDTSTWKEIDPGSGHAGPANAVAFSPDGRTVATGGLDQTLILWSWPEGREIRRIEGVGSGWGVQHLAFSPDGRTVAASAWINLGDTFFLFDAGAGTPLAHFGKDHQGQGQMVFLHGGREILTAQTDGSLAIWDAASGKFLRSLGKQKEGLNAVQPGPDSETAWCICPGSLSLRNLTTGRDERTFQTKVGFSMDQTHLSVAPNGDWLAVGNRVFDARTGEALTHGLGDKVRNGFEQVSAISPDGRVLAFPWDRKIVLWDALAQCQIRTLGNRVEGIHDLAFSPDATVLAVAGDSGVQLWDMTGRLQNGRLSAAQLTAKDMASLWTVLGGDDAAAADQALWTLAAGGKTAVLFLGQHLNPAVAPDAAHVEALRKDLSDADYDVRDNAARTLVDLGIILTPEERELLRRPDPASRLISATGRPVVRPLRLLPPPVLLPLPERLRATRAIAVLEHSLERADAVALLTRLADGAPDAPFTREAKAALSRAGGAEPRDLGGGGGSGDHR